MVKREEKKKNWLGNLFNLNSETKKNPTLTNSENPPYTPPYTLSTTSFSSDTSQVKGNFSRRTSDSNWFILAQKLRESGIDITKSGWEEKLKSLLEVERLLRTFRKEKSELVSEKDRLLRENHEIKSELCEEKAKAKQAILDKDKRANITPKNLENLQDEKDNLERELGILESTLKDLLGIVHTDPLSNWINIIESWKNDAEKEEGLLNDLKTLLGEDLTNPLPTYWKITLESWKNDVAVTNYNNEVVAHNRTKNQLSASLVTEKNNHDSTRRQLTVAQVAIDSFQRKLGISDLNNLLSLPVGTTNLEDLITQFNNLINEVINLTKKYTTEKERVNDYKNGLQGIFGTTTIDDTLSPKDHVGSIRGNFDQKEKSINALTEYRNALTDQIKLDISIPSWKNDLAAKLGGKNLFEIPFGRTLKDLIDGINTITDLQRKLNQEKNELQQQKIDNQRLNSENLCLQQEVNNRETSLLKYFINKLNLKLENNITKEQTLAEILKLINRKPSEEFVQELQQKIHEQEKITNYQKEKGYVEISTIQKEVTQFLKNYGIGNANDYQTQIYQSTSYQQITALQQQEISKEMNKIKSSEKFAKNLNLFLSLLFCLVIIIKLWTKINNLKERELKKIIK